MGHLQKLLIFCSNSIREEQPTTPSIRNEVGVICVNYINFASRPTCTSRNKVMLMMTPPLLRYFWFHSFYSLDASCSLQSAVSSLQSAICKCLTPVITTRSNRMKFRLLGEKAYVNILLFYWSCDFLESCSFVRHFWYVFIWEPFVEHFKIST